MEAGRLALLLPTIRFDAGARHAIDTVCSLASGDIHAYIADNSCNPEKWAYLRKKGRSNKNVHVYCHTENIGIGQNSSFLYGVQEDEFQCVLSDDDMYTPDYILSGFEELKRNPGCVVASGLLLHLTTEGSTIQIVAPGSITQTRPVERIGIYNNAYNSITYGVFRRSAATRFTDYLKDRPFFPTYMDQFLSYSLLSTGIYIVDPTRRAFIYNNDNWSSANHERNSGRFFDLAGLTTKFHHLNLLCWAVDALHFFQSIYAPPALSNAEAVEISYLLYTRFHSHFLQLVAADTPLYLEFFRHSPEALEAFRAIVCNARPAVEDAVSLFATLMRVFNAELAARYLSFALVSIRPVQTSTGDLWQLVGAAQPPMRLASA